MWHLFSHVGAALKEYYYSYEKAIESVARKTEWDIE
jgi:hypothetical protein